MPGVNEVAYKLAGDTNERYILQDDGKMIWGSGAAIGDAILTRSATSTLALTGSLTVSGTFAPTGAVTTTGALAVGTTLTVTGASTLTGAVTTTGALAVGTTLTVTGASTLTGAVTTTGALAVGTTLAVTSTSTLTGAVTTTGALTVGTTLTLSGGIMTTSQASVPTIPSPATGWGTITFSTDSTDTAGKITFTVTGTPAASAVAMPVVFNRTYAAAPKAVTLTMGDSSVNDPITIYYITGLATTGFTIATNATGAAQAAKILYYHVDF